MNKEIIEGNWHEIKGHLKQHWGKLTEDEITEIEGSLEKLQGILEKKYGYQKEEVQKQIQQFLDKNNWKGR
jgi:uncharacterized protein YjbJ (UPF0337 family)